MVVLLRNLTVRVDDKTFNEIKELAELEKTDKSTITRKILDIGLRELKKRRALELYREGKCTLWKAAQIAEISLREMIELTKMEKIPVHISSEDVNEAWREAFEEK